MEFKSGMLGVCIVALALISSVMFGFASAVTEREYTDIEYNKITDVTGLFPRTNEPLYKNYNTSVNYTGWSPYENVGYEESLTAYNYRMTTDITSYTQNVTFDYGSDWTFFDDNTDFTVYQENQENDNTGMYLGKSDGSSEYYTGTAGYIHVRDLLTKLGIDYLMTSEITINLLDNWHTMIVNGDAYMYNTNVVCATYGSTMFNSGYLYTSNGVFKNSGLYKAYYGTAVQDNLGDSYNPNSSIAPSINNYITVTNTGVVTVHIVSNTKQSTDYEHYTYQTNLASPDCMIVWSDILANHSGSKNNGDYNYVYNSFNAQEHTHNIEVSWTNVSSKYLKISGGVWIENGSEMEWSNGYDNQSVSMILHHDVGKEYNYYFTLTGSDGLNKNVQINVTSEQTTVTVDTAVQIGNWSDFIIVFNKDNITVTPITNFVDFLNYSTADYEITVGVLNNSVINNIKLTLFSTPDEDNNPVYSDSPKLIVNNTYVFMNTYNTVIKDSTLDIRDLFPSSTYSELRLSLSSFAVYGTSVIINGTSYNISNGNININGNDLLFKEVDIDYVSNGSERVVVLRVGSTAIPLGTQNNTEVTLNGIWAVTGEVYEITETTNTVTEWNLGTWDLSANQTILIFIGLTAVLTLVFSKIFDISVVDWIVIVVAGFIGLGMLL